MGIPMATGLEDCHLLNRKLTTSNYIGCLSKIFVLLMYIPILAVLSIYSYILLESIIVGSNVIYSVNDPKLLPAAQIYAFLLNFAIIASFVFIYTAPLLLLISIYWIKKKNNLRLVLATGYFSIVALFYNTRAFDWFFD